jgi:hypothetical protein
MAYYIDAENIGLDDLQKRIEETDLVPSRISLLDGLETKLQILEQQGITTLARLRYELKTAKRRESLSDVTGIDLQYLILLRREVEGYFPKPVALKAFDWLPKEEITRLEENGIHNVAVLYEAASSAGSKTELAGSIGVDATVFEALVRLADLTRVQWVSPKAARMLIEAGYDSAFMVAAADSEDLHQALIRVNEGNRFFKGKIGLRDIKRLIQAASYVSGWVSA